MTWSTTFDINERAGTGIRAPAPALTTTTLLEAMAVMATRYPNIPGIVFKSIDRFPGYCFGDDGSAWSCKGDGGHRGASLDEWHRLRPKVGRGGHLCVTLFDDLHQRHYMDVSRLILEAFVGPCPPGLEACHFPDRDPGNNRPGNLRWDTRKSNMADKVIHGTMARGEKVGRAKMTVDDVREIRRLNAEGVGYGTLSRRFGIGRTQVARIVRGESWAHTKEDVS